VASWSRRRRIKESIEGERRGGRWRGGGRNGRGTAQHRAANEVQRTRGVRSTCNGKSEGAKRAREVKVRNKERQHTEGVVPSLYLFLSP
jgi:hypothetical protein